MANVFVNIPLPTGDGVGAPVDVSALGREKTFQVAGTYQGTVTFEGSNDGGASWVTILTFTRPASKITLAVAVQQLRLAITGSNGVLPTSCGVSSSDDGGRFATLAPTLGAGTGVPTDISLLGVFSTVIVSGSFAGTVNIEISDDGLDYVECMSFTGSGYQSKPITAQFMRVTRKNVGVIPGLPTVSVGAINNIAGLVERTVFVYDEGATPVDNVYNDWATLMADVDAVEGLRTIQFRGDGTIPAGTWDMTDVRWYGLPSVGFGSAFPLVNITEGAVFPNLRWITGLDIANNATATVPVTQGALDEYSSMRIDGGTQLGVGGGERGSGTVPFIEVTAGGLLAIQLHDASWVSSTTASPNIRGNGLSLSISMFNGSRLYNQDGPVVDIVAGSAFVVGDQTARIDEGAVTGTFSVSGTFIDNFRLDRDSALNAAASRNAELGLIHRQDTTAAPCTLTLPVVTEHSVGRIVGVANEGGNNIVTVAPQAGDTLDNVVDGTLVVAPGARAVFLVATSGTWLTLWQADAAGAQHRQLDQLVHDIAETSFEEVAYNPDGTVANVIVWTDNLKTTRIRATNYTYTAGEVTQVETIQYDASGLAITGETLTETFTYVAGNLDNIDRVLS
jgi:hypothetical protein